MYPKDVRRSMPFSDGWLNFDNIREEYVDRLILYKLIWSEELLPGSFILIMKG